MSKKCFFVCSIFKILSFTIMAAIFFPYINKVIKICLVRGLEVTFLALWPNFLVEDTLGHEQERFFFPIFKILIFTILAAILMCFFYVCSRARGRIFCARYLIFWLRTPWDMCKKVFFSDFQNFDFYDNGGHFDVFFMSVRGLEVAFFALET